MWFWGKRKQKLEIEPSGMPREIVTIRLEAIGGQGANSAGKILAEAAILHRGYTGNHFSSFGSEKRGTPVKSYVRFSPVRKVIRSATAIAEPKLLVIFHEQLILTHPEIFEGVTGETDVLINSAKEPHELVLPISTHPRWLGSVPASEIAHKLGSGLNSVMLGAMVPFLPELEANHIQKVLKEFFSSRSDLNEKSFEEGWSAVKIKTPLPFQNRKIESPKSWIRMGYENAPLGGIITQPGNSILKNHEASRKGFAPALDLNVCCHCGYCDQVCPDFCFEWKMNPQVGKGAELLRLNYQYCKGCQKCIEVCPVDALTLTKESELKKL